MRNLLLQRWAWIFLLVSRLIVGELGHAMPVATTSWEGAESTLTERDPAVCPEHETATQSQSTAPPSSGADSNDKGEHNCCKTGECECPCLHVPCAALDADIASDSHLELHRIPDGIHGLMLQRLSGLFRPPA